MKTKEQATKLGQKLISKLGKKWKLRVWENLGWSYSADWKEGHLSVSPTYDGKKYFVLLSDSNHTHCGAYLWLDNKTYKNPKDAVKNQLKLARKAINNLEKRVKEVEGSIL